MEILSSAFKNGKSIPKKYTADGENISPPFSFEQIPKGTVYFNISCRDPDAGSKSWVHWNIDISGRESSIPEDYDKKGGKKIIKTRKNSWGNKKYEGPKPPRGSGDHRYIFRLTAYDENGDPVAKAKIMGLYSRK